MAMSFFFKKLIVVTLSFILLTTGMSSSFADSVIETISLDHNVYGLGTSPNFSIAIGSKLYVLNEG
jgi:hypothetical protein